MKTTGHPRPLGRRQREALTHAANGYTSKEIARMMGISYNTVISAFGQIYMALGARNREQAIALGIKYREIDLNGVHSLYDEPREDAA